jgi:hypothetical protein
MYEKLDAYLEEISHFLSGRKEREEILAEIRSHILEKTEREFGEVTEETLEKVIAAYGPARRVAEEYLEGRPIIALAYRRFLFRYAGLLFSIHFLFIVAAVIFKESFVVFPFLYLPRLGVAEAILYLPTAFLTDLGIVALVLYLITQSEKDVKLPWPKLAVDLEEIKSPATVPWLRRVGILIGMNVMLALTGFALWLYAKFQTIFLANLNFKEPKPLLMPDPGRRISLIIIVMFAAAVFGLFIKLFTSSRWVDVGSNCVSLVLIGLLLRQPFDNLFAINVPAWLLPKIKVVLTALLLFIAIMTTIDLIKNLVILGRKKLAN